MNNQIEITFGEIGKAITGKTPSSDDPEDFGVGYPFVTPTDSLDSKYVLHTARQLSEDGLRKLKSKALPPDSIMVSCIGSAMGKVVMNSTMCITNQQFNSIVVDTDRFCQHYVYYALRNSYKLLRNAASGSTALPMLNKTDFEKLKIRVFKDKAQQRKIAAVLSALDAKIALNHRINSELEGMAKLLYDYWFEQYDFPLSAAQAAALGKPRLAGQPYRTSGGKMVFHEQLKREIPVGWEVKSIPQIAPILTGKRDANHATTDGEYHFFTCADQALRCDDFAFDGRAILLAGNGSFGVKIHEGKFNAYQRTYVLIPNDKRHFSSIWFAVKNSVASLTKGSRGSIVKFLTKGDIEAIPVLLPPENSEDLFSPINDALLLTLANHQQNQELTTLRDWLLPMLMNGQVRVG